MLISISSNNDNMSYIIGKSPMSLPKAINLKKGFCVGWYDENLTYWVRFVDGHDEISYEEYEGQGFEYLGATKYFSAQCGLNIIKEYIHTLYKEYDKVSGQKFTVNSVFVKNRSKHTLEKYFPVTFKNIAGNYYTLTLTCEDTFENSRDMLEVILLFILLDSGQNFYADHKFITKYAKKIHKMRAPYFMRYLFKTNLLKSKSLFNDHVQYLNIDNSTFTFGNLHSARMAFAQQNIVDEHIIDVGCGEGKYYNRLINYNKSYIGVDTDKSAIDLAVKRHFGVAESFVRGDVTSITPDKGCTVLCSEVIEHIEWDDVPKFLQSIIDICPNKIVITTPNSDFNQYYPIEDNCSRHDDHKWEKNKDEVTQLLQSIPGYNHNCFDIGDIVNGISGTQGHILWK